MVPVKSQRLKTGPFKRLGMPALSVLRCTYKTKTDRPCNRVFTHIAETIPLTFLGALCAMRFVFFERLEAVLRASTTAIA
jgi:hypothetical protein